MSNDTKLKIVEVKANRDFYGGGDGNAINRHAERIYDVGGAYYEINKTLDGVPPFYELLTRGDLVLRDYNGYKSVESLSDRYNPYFPKTIQVDGEDYWGSGLTWREAEALAFEAMREDI